MFRSERETVPRFTPTCFAQIRTAVFRSSCLRGLIPRISTYPSGRQRNTPRSRSEVRTCIGRRRTLNPGFRMAMFRFAYTLGERRSDWDWESASRRFSAATSYAKLALQAGISIIPGQIGNRDGLGRRSECQRHHNGLSQNSRLICAFGVLVATGILESKIAGRVEGAGVGNSSFMLVRRFLPKRLSASLRSPIHGRTSRKRSGVCRAGPAT